MVAKSRPLRRQQNQKLRGRTRGSQRNLRVKGHRPSNSPAYHPCVFLRCYLPKGSCRLHDSGMAKKSRNLPKSFLPQMLPKLHNPPGHRLILQGSSTLRMDLTRRPSRRLGVNRRRERQCLRGCLKLKRSADVMFSFGGLPVPTYLIVFKILGQTSCDTCSFC